MLKITKEIQGKLKRICYLNKVLIENDYFPDEQTLTEYHLLKSEMVEEFLPLLNVLAEARLLHVLVGEEAQDALNGNWHSAFLEIGSAFDNGTIWLHASESVGGVTNEQHIENIKNPKYSC